MARVGVLRQAGFEVVATFPNRAHFAIVMEVASRVVFGSLRSWFSEPLTNPGYRPDR